MSTMPQNDTVHKLSNNLCRLLVELSKDFQSRVLTKAHVRGHHRIRQSHSSLFSNLGFGAIRLTELAEKAGISQQAMGKLVKEMEAEGYVKRHVDEVDKRAKIIEPTELGVKLVNDSLEIVEEVLQEYRETIGVECMSELEQKLNESAKALGLKHLSS